MQKKVRVFDLYLLNMIERVNNAGKETRVCVTPYLKHREIKRSQRDQLATTHRDIVLTRIFFHDLVIDRAP